MIAEKWAKFSKIPPKAVEDVVLTGGNANYNYTSQSDLDLHLILDFSKVKECKDIGDVKRWISQDGNINKNKIQGIFDALFLETLTLSN